MLESLHPSVDKQYRDLVQKILLEGQEKTDPQGVGNLSVHGHMFTFDLSTGRFPLLGLRDLRDRQGSFKSLPGELLWFIEGSTNVADLHKRGVHFWDPWVKPTQNEFGYPEGELGPIYGKQWRDFEGVDQLAKAMSLLSENPDSRRIAVTAWHPRDINKVFVAPCIRYFQYHHAQGRLGLSIVQGSADIGVGVPFDNAEYALLLLMTARVHNMQPGLLNHFLIDAHIYKNHLDAMRELIKRKETPEPSVVINSHPPSIFEFNQEDFELVNYQPHPMMRLRAAL